MAEPAPASDPAAAPAAGDPAAQRPAAADEVLVRRVEPSDYEGIAKLVSFPRVIWGTLQMPYQSKDDWKARLAANNPKEHVSLCAIVGGELVASASMMLEQRPRTRHMATLGISVRDDFQGRGIGTKLMAALVDLADNWYNLVRLELTVYTDNAPAIRLYKKLGFVVEGTQVAHAFRDGQYIDAYLMARLRPGFVHTPTVPPS